MNPSGPGVSHVLLLGAVLQATPFGTVVPPDGVEIYPVPRSIAGDPAVDPAPDAVIEGVVLDASTSRPIDGARVTLTPVQVDPIAGATLRPGAPYRGVSDADGRFVVEALPGLYDVSADADGFVSGSVRGLRAHVSLAAGQRVRDWGVRLTRGAAVTGAVRDANGDPVEGAVVTAVRESFRLGRRTLGPCDFPPPRGGASQTTGERGEYRLFDLAPGNYYVAAQFGGAACDVPAYYPGVVDPILAAPIRAITGGEVSGIDIVAHRDARYGVRFEVLDRSGMSDERSRHVRIVRRGADGVESSVLAGSADRTLRRLGAGRFATLPVLPPGSYDLYVNDSVSYGSVSAGRLDFDVRDRDVEAGVLVIPPPVPIQGVVRTAERAPPSADGPLDVVLEPLEGWHESIPSLYWFGLEASGEFAGERSVLRISGVAEGRYRVRMTGLEPDMYLSSIRYGGEDASVRGYVDVSADRAGRRIELVVDGPGGVLEGVVRDGRDAPVPGRRAVVVPLGPHRGNLGRFRSVFTDRSGRFIVRGLPPGDYGVLAWEHVADDAWFRPEFIRPLETRMTRVHVEKGDFETLDIRIIARDE